MVLRLLMPLALCGVSACVASDRSIDRTWGLGDKPLAPPPAKAEAAPAPAPAPGPSLTDALPAVPGSQAPVKLAAQPEDAAERPAVASPNALSAADSPAAAFPAENRDTPADRAAHYRSSGEAAMAATLYRQILDSAPDDADAGFGYAHALLDDGLTEQAAPVVLELLDRHSGSARALVLVARLELARGDFTAAATRLAAAEALAPDDRGVLALRGMLSDLQGDHAAAQRSYRLALAADPSDMAVRNNLAFSMISAGNPGGAVAVLESLMPDAVTAPASMRHNLALAYGLMGRDGDAARLLAFDLDRGRVDENLAFYSWLRERQRGSRAGAESAIARKG